MVEGAAPDISFVMPCYNEQDAIPYTIPQLVKAFEQAGHRLELVACDNGSTDRTGEIIRQFAASGLPVIHHRVDRNEGYGNGILKAIPVCSAPWIGIIAADGQVDAEDAARLFETVRHSDGRVLGKVRRRFRLDGLVRKIVSILYNGFVFVLWPRLGLHRRQRESEDRPPRRAGDDGPAVEGLVLRSGAHDQGPLPRHSRDRNERVRSDAIERAQPRPPFGMRRAFVNLLRFRFGGALSSWRARRVGGRVESTNPEFRAR